MQRRQVVRPDKPLFDLQGSTIANGDDASGQRLFLAIVGVVSENGK